jgi:Co/Zn/Cd efflux system component
VEGFEHGSMSSRSIIEIHVPECNWEWPVLSNEFVLVLSISLFLIFAIAELFGALASDSLSLLGDSICMFVDVTSYICSTYVEWYKARSGRVTFGSRIFTEIIVPTLSVLSLLGVTVYITVDAVAIVKNQSASNTVNVGYLYSYSVANLIVDVICNFLFFLKGEDAFLEETVDIPKLSLDTSIDIDDEVEFGRLEDDQLMWENRKSSSLRRAEEGGGISLVYRFFRVYCCGFCASVCHWPSMSAYETSHQHNHSQHHHPGHSHVHKSNLNMLSAFSHVLGDTFRTLSTLLAAIVSTATGINGEICDAWAAIAVSITILILCVLLLWEIKDAALDIWDEDCVEIGGGNGDANSAVSTARAITVAFPTKSVSKQQSGPRNYDSSKPVSRDNRSGPVHSYQRVAENDEDIVI